MKTIRYFLFGILFTSMFFACDKTDSFETDGMAPIYISSTDFSMIKSEDARPFVTLGNIIIRGNYLYINEKGKGIHVIDNTDPKNPVFIAFWNIPGNTEFNIKGNLLYADNSIHLLTIDISDIHHIVVKSYTENVFIDLEPINPRPPSDYNGYFYCVDKNKGVHIGWENAHLKDPRCETF